MLTVLSLQMLPAHGLTVVCDGSQVSCDSDISCRSDQSCFSFWSRVMTEPEIQ